MTACCWNLSEGRDLFLNKLADYDWIKKLWLSSLDLDLNRPFKTPHVPWMCYRVHLAFTCSLNCLKLPRIVFHWREKNNNGKGIQWYLVQSVGWTLNLIRYYYYIIPVGIPVLLVLQFIHQHVAAKLLHYSTPTTQTFKKGHFVLIRN